ncbi:hypothetical protein Tco_1430712, partial [Tanacetum coccineum]
KFDGKSNEGYLLGYSTSNQPNETETSPNWMFDLDFLPNSMNYIPVSVENQVNVDAGTQDSYVAEDVAPATHEKPSESSLKDNDIQDLKDVIDKEGQHQMLEDEQVLHDELEKIVTQELIAKAMDDVSRQAFEEEKRRIASQKKAAQATSTNILSTDRPSVSIASTPTGTNAGESSFVYLGGKIPIDASTLPNADLPIDPNMPNLEDASDTLLNDLMMIKMRSYISSSNKSEDSKGFFSTSLEVFSEGRTMLVVNNTTNAHQFTMSNRLQELASPKQTVLSKANSLGKDFPNPFMAGSFPKTIKQSNDPPLSRGYILGSGEDSLELMELIDGLEKDLLQTKKTYSTALTKLVLRVKKLESKLKSGKARRKAKIVLSDDEEIAENSSK